MIETNINLFFTIVGASVTAFLGILVYFHDRKSATNRIFIVHSTIGVIWAIVNYFSLLAPVETALFWIRFVVFLAVPHVFLFFLFVYNFPSEKIIISRKLYAGILATMLSLMGLVLSPFVFQSIREEGVHIVPNPGPLMPIFAPILILFFLLTFFLVIRKYLRSQDIIRRQWLAISIGLVSTYSMLIFLVFFRVVALNDTTFVPYSPLLILPIFVGATVAILRHHLFNIKVIATEILTFLLLIGSFVQLLNSKNSITLFVNIFTTLFLFYFGILLIKSVLKEVEQREQLQKLTEDLKAANVKLEDLSRFKTQLLSLASHQVKSPLAAIKGFASILSDGLYGPVNDKIKETLGKIRFSSDELISLVNNLLDLRKVEEGKMEYQFAKADLVKMIAEIVAGLQPLALEKKLELAFETDLKELSVNADAIKLKQVMQNLIDNAIKYTPSGFVKVMLRQDPSSKEIIFSVNDSGLGISAKLIPHLFEEFIRDDRVKQYIRGTGLGLFIARKIIEAHGGKLSAESPGEGKGSTFKVTLPQAG